MSGNPRRVIGAWHAFAVGIGIVVGAGIFRTPSLVAGGSSTPNEFLLAWVAGGLLSIIGALCYAELASTYPHPGGDYHFLERAFGRRLAFLYGWSRLTVIQTGSLALLAYIFADYVSAGWPIGPNGNVFYAAGLIVVLTALNCLGVRQGANAQLWMTVLEILGFSVLIALALIITPIETESLPSPGMDSAFGLILVFVLLTYGGWSEIAYLSAELQGGRRLIAAVLIGSLVFVTGFYLLVNWAYLQVLGLEGIASSDAVAADVMGAAIGPAGVLAVSFLVALAAVTSANATAITGARTNYALGAAHPGLGWLEHWDRHRATPINGFMLQGVIALLLVIGASFGRDEFTRIVEYTAPVFWLFLFLVGIAQFVLRWRDPEIQRPFKTPFYPVTPAIFCTTSAYLLYSSILYTGLSAIVGLMVLAAGAVLLGILQIYKPMEAKS